MSHIVVKTFLGEVFYSLPSVSELLEGPSWGDCELYVCTHVYVCVCVRVSICTCVYVRVYMCEFV